MPEPRVIELRVANLDCEHDAAALRRGLAPLPGLDEVKVYPRSGKVRLTYDAARLREEDLKAHLVRLGFPPHEQAGAVELPPLWRNPKVLTSAAAGVLWALGMLTAALGAPSAVGLGLHLAAIVIGGYYFGREAWQMLWYERQVGIELLMGVAAVVAVFLGQASEGAMLVFLYSISEALEGYTEAKTRAAVRALMKLAPKTALVRRQGREVEIPAEQVREGDVFVVKPGQAVPTDGIVLEGRSSVDQSPITGESVPVDKGPGDRVFAASINQQGLLVVRATKPYAENTLQRIIHMVEEAQERKGRQQRWIEAFGRRYSPAVLLAAMLMAVGPPMLGLGPWALWLERATVFVVAAAPCALVMSVPITMVATLGTAARQGVLIKGGVFVEELARTRAMAFDKTGTLTLGQPQVTDVHPLAPGWDAARVLAWAAAVEQGSEHPLARAVVLAAQAHGVTPPAARDFQALPGTGVQATVGELVLAVLRPERVPEATAYPHVAQWRAQGKTVAVLAQRAGQTWRPLGLLAFRDEPRPHARPALGGLRRLGVRPLVMLTGDHPRTAQALAQELGLDQVYADLRPEDKVARVRELTQRHGHVAMVGDGVNDAPALAAASVGIAMGAAGTDVALETADVALMGDDLTKLPAALTLARRAQRIVWQNIVLSLAVTAGLMLAAITGALGLPAAVIGHEISEFVVIGNGLRMLRGAPAIIRHQG